MADETDNSKTLYQFCCADISIQIFAVKNYLCNSKARSFCVDLADIDFLFILAEDFDFDFIDSTIKSSTDELHSALQACFDEIKGI